MKGFMKKPNKKKSAKSKTPAAESPAPAAPANPPQIVYSSRPPVEVLLAQAENEEDQQELLEYAQVIGVLREKHFSYREIAEWLNERGFQTDRNAVYRLYCKTLHPAEAEQEYNEAAEEDAKDI
jgi:hypothetical protein